MTGVPSQAKRQAILEAATEAFLRSGYAASVDEIAASAGVGKQTVYRHFGDKESLFLAAVSAARTAGYTSNPPDWSLHTTAREAPADTHATGSTRSHETETEESRTTRTGDRDTARVRGSSAAGGSENHAAGTEGHRATETAGTRAREGRGRRAVETTDSRAVEIGDDLGVEALPAGDNRPISDPALPDTGDPVTDLTAIGEQILAAALSPTVAALHRLTIAEIGNHPELSRHWGDGAAPFVDDALAGYFRHRHEVGSLDVPDPSRAARQFAYLLVTEGRIASAYGTRPMTPEERHRLAAETADLIVRAHRPR